MARLADGLAVAVSAPASSANLGPGFDSIGLALGVWDDYRVRVGSPGGGGGGDAAGLRIEVSGEGATQVPRDARHLVYRCLARGLAALGYAVPADLQLHCVNRVPHSRGLGSSATAAVAGFALANALVAAHADVDADPELPLDLDFIGELAAQAEGHPDNSSASVHGGLTVSWSEDVAAVAGVHTVRIAVHPEIEPLVLVPDIELSTAAARAALPTDVPLKSASLNAGRAALLVEAMTRRPELLLAATRDWLHQEQRRIAYPATMRVVDGLRRAGLAAVVSGAGPTVMVLVTRSAVADARSVARDVVAGESAHWEIATPGVPPTGVQASRWL